MRLLLTLFICINSIVVFCKPTVNDTLKKKIHNIEIQQARFIKTNDSLIIANTKLAKELDYKKELLDEYNKLNGNTFNIINGLFAFFGIIIPIFGYFFVVKPAKDNIKESQKLLDDTRNNMDKLFLEYITKNRDKIIDNAIMQIEQNNTAQISNSINCLDTYRYEGFNDKQIVRFILLIKNEHSRTDFFMRILCSTESVFTTDFFIDYIKKNPTNNLSTWAALYAAKYNRVEFLDNIAEYIIQTRNLTGVLASVRSESGNYLLQLYNNEKLTNNLDSETLINHMSHSDTYDTKESAKARNDRQESKLYKKYLEVKSPDPK